MNFSFVLHETTKLGLQRIMVESFDASKVPLLEVLCIIGQKFLVDGVL